jgi:hypothetical protein
MKMAVYWVVAPCSLVEVYQRFRGLYCLHHQGDHYLHHCLDDRGSIDLCNAGNLITVYTALHPRRQPSSLSQITDHESIESKQLMCTGVSYYCSCFFKESITIITPFAAIEVWHVILISIYYIDSVKCHSYRYCLNPIQTFCDACLFIGKLVISLRG